MRAAFPGSRHTTAAQYQRTRRDGRLEQSQCLGSVLSNELRRVAQKLHKYRDRIVAARLAHRLCGKQPDVMAWMAQPREESFTDPRIAVVAEAHRCFILELRVIQRAQQIRNRFLAPSCRKDIDGAVPDQRIRMPEEACHPGERWVVVGIIQFCEGAKDLLGIIAVERRA